MIRLPGLDIIPLVGTFICCLALGIEIGLICGVGVDVLLLLYYHSRPPLDMQYVEDDSLPPHYAIHPAGGLHFAGAEKFRSTLTELRKPNVKVPNIQTLETLSVIPESDHTVNGLSHANYTNGNNIRSGITEANSIRRGISDTRRIPNSLVIYCDSLHRMDYTFLQSVKMLVSEWSRCGRVVWCGARPFVKEQLNSVLHDPVFCDRSQLQFILTDAFTSGDHHLAVSDTQL